MLTIKEQVQHWNRIQRKLVQAEFRRLHGQGRYRKTCYCGRQFFTSRQTYFLCPPCVRAKRAGHPYGRDLRE